MNQLSMLIKFEIMNYVSLSECANLRKPVDPAAQDRKSANNFHTAAAAQGGESVYRPVSHDCRESVDQLVAPQPSRQPHGRLPQQPDLPGKWPKNMAVLIL